MSIRRTLAQLGLIASLISCSAQPEIAAQNNSIQETPIQRCMNISGALEAPTEGLWGYTVRLEDIDRIAAAGFDTVRLPVKWSAHSEAEQPYTIDTELLARTDEIIDHALSRGLQVILNVHHYDELNNDPDTHENRLAAIWQQLSVQYQGYPNELIFELINEPHSKMTLRRVDRLNKRLLGQVRTTHPDRWIILGTGHWGALEGLLASRPPIDERTILSLHYYEPFGFTHQGAFFVDPPLPTGRSWGSEQEKTTVQSDFQKAAEFAMKSNSPLLLGEFGVYEEVPLNDRADWTKHTRQSAEAFNMGWCYWGFASTFKSFDQEDDAWLKPITDALLKD